MSNEGNGMPSGPNPSSSAGNMSSAYVMQGIDGEHLAQEDQSSLHYGTGVNRGLFPQYLDIHGNPMIQSDQSSAGYPNMDASGPSLQHGDMQDNWMMQPDQSSSGYPNMDASVPFPQYDNTHDNQIMQPGQSSRGCPNMDTSGQHPAPPTQHPTTIGAFKVPLWSPANTNFPNMMASMPHINPKFFNPAMVGNMPGPSPMIPLYPAGFSQPMSTMAGAAPDDPISRSESGSDSWRPSDSAERPSNVAPDGADRPTSRYEGDTPIQPSKGKPKRPIATERYLKQASEKPQKCSERRPLLVILDLNGTLIYRKNRKFPPTFVKRQELDSFLKLLFERYAVMVWSSAQPNTVKAVCKRIFSRDQRQALVAEWGRDRFDLTKDEYNSKVQVYKKLSTVWRSSEVQATCPRIILNDDSPSAQSGYRNRETYTVLVERFRESWKDGKTLPRVWDQTNTVLIDDSPRKATSEPYNILGIPEFTDPKVKESGLFARVLTALDMISQHDDASKVIHKLWLKAKQQKCRIVDMRDIIKEEDKFCWIHGEVIDEDARDDKGNAGDWIVDADIDELNRKAREMPDDAMQSAKALKEKRRNARKAERVALEKILTEENADMEPPKLKKLIKKVRNELHKQQLEDSEHNQITQKISLVEVQAKAAGANVKKRKPMSDPLARARRNEERRMKTEERRIKRHLKKERRRAREAKAKGTQEKAKADAAAGLTASTSLATALLVLSQSVPDSDFTSDDDSCSCASTTSSSSSDSDFDFDSTSSREDSKSNPDSAIDANSSGEAVGISRPHTDSPALSSTSSPSENFLLDRLEESLGFNTDKQKEVIDRYV